MNTLDAIYSRRSIRKFTEETVSDEQVQILMKAAMAAPSATNEQAWRFVIIRDKNTMNSIQEFHPFASMLATANLVIAVLGDLTEEHHPGYWPLDTSAATQNLLLAAHELGLGAVWLGVYPRDERMRAVSELLELPEEYPPLCLIPIGHPAEEKMSVDRFNPEKVHLERFTQE